MSEWQLVEYQGRLAVTLGWSTLNERPVEQRSLWVSPTVKWDEWWYSQYTQIRLLPGTEGTFMCYSSRTWLESPLYTQGWQHYTEERAVPKPRYNSKIFKVEWTSGRWMKIRR